MCWFVNFEITLIDKRGKTEIEKQVLDYKVKISKKGIDMVSLIQGSMEEGFRTALHCDCDNIITVHETKNQKLLHYPGLFDKMIQEPRVKNIRVWWFWGKDKEKRKEKKLTIKEFLALNEKGELRTDVSYRILKESYI